MFDVKAASDAASESVLGGMGGGSVGIGVGVVGCGGFALFALQQFAQVPNVRIVGISETNAAAASAAIARFGLPDPVDMESLVARPDVDLVYIATPPFLHYSQALQALRAGKHVLVEKPPALALEEMDQLIDEASGRGLLLAVNLMQRYNPLFDAARGLLERKPLGELLHGYFENYASDEQLGPEHWFWDSKKSGGIFVEHGVHFFELFAGWLGEGKVESAEVCRREATGAIDQVQCTVRYRDDVLVNFYHGFTQPKRLDRQELRLVFERGDVLLEEWVPTRATIRAIVSEADLRTLVELFPNSQLEVTATYAGEDRQCRGRNKALDAAEMVVLRSGWGEQKMERYGELVRALFVDQLQWVADRRHVRKLTELEARAALATALAAERMSQG